MLWFIARSEDMMPARIIARVAVLIVFLVTPVLVTPVLVTPAVAQDLSGGWQGVLKLSNGGQLRLLFHFEKAPDSRYAGTMDSPDQGASDIPLGAVTAAGRDLVFDVPSIEGTFRGTWDGERWNGAWTQGSSKLPLSLVRTTGENTPVPGSAAALVGDWDGILDLGVSRLRLVVRVRVTKTGTSASLDSVDQAAKGIPISAIRVDGAKVRLALQSIDATFEGVLEPDGRSVIGRWTQAKGTLPLTLTRRVPGAPDPVLERPQMPRPPFPYRAEEVAFENATAKVRLAGTLTLPKGSGPFPAVLLIAGSGPLDRDESLFGHKPFLVLADHLTRQGIAVLRVDKRGVGKSTGDFNSATTADLASDVEAGLVFLRSRGDIDARKIGLVGHSEGGLIAPLVASRDPTVAFAVLLAAPGVPGLEIAVAQAVEPVKREGWSEQRYTQFAALMRKAFAAAADAPSEGEAIKRATAIMQAGTDITGLSDDQLNRMIANWRSIWFRYFLAFDPGPALRQVKIPVLVMNGSLDLQVRSEDNIAAIRKALASNADAEIHALPGLNHLFQTAKTGQMEEYAAIAETFAPSALDLMTNWIVARTR